MISEITQPTTTVPPITLAQISSTRRCNSLIRCWASANGAATNPAWYYNLQANPNATIETGTETIPVTARVADPAEREPIWTRQKQAEPGFAEYETKTDRQIPVVILEPAQG